MYMGETVEASPTPMPPTNRQTINAHVPGRRTADGRHEEQKGGQDRGPFSAQGVGQPNAASGPKGQPKMALPITTPNQNGREIRTPVFRKMMAPEIKERS